MHLEDFMSVCDNVDAQSMFNDEAFMTDRRSKIAMSVDVFSSPSRSGRADTQPSDNAPVGLLKVSNNSVSLLDRQPSTPLERGVIYPKEDSDAGSDSEAAQSYRLWLQEQKIREEDGKQHSQVKNEEEESPDEHFPVETMLERGPSPPESENESAYEWSYEEQFKQLYEIDGDPARKSFLDEYFEFMKARGTPVSRIPIMAKQILDLFQLYNLVVKHGGLVQVIRNKQWSKITKGLNLPTSITSAAFTLRTQYLKYMYSYECSVHNFSTPKELQAAIDSNRRDRFSTLYHAEPTMTPPREDRFLSYPMNGLDYTPTMPPRHIPHHILPGPQPDARYPLKRPGEPLMSKSYDKYAPESPKVIVLQDGTSSSDSRSGKLSPVYRSRSRSPLPMRESDFHSLAELEAARRRTQYLHSAKDWDGEVRHVVEEESRRRLIDDVRSRGIMCKDKNCNGIDCQYGRPDQHRQGSHDHVLGICACSYCKGYPRQSGRYTPPRRDRSREVARCSSMESAAVPNSDAAYNGEVVKPDFRMRSSSIIPLPANDGVVERALNAPLTTIKMKLPDVRQNAGGIHISIDVAGTVYEGVIMAKISPRLNGDRERGESP